MTRRQERREHGQHDGEANLIAATGAARNPHVRPRMDRLVPGGMLATHLRRHLRRGVGRNVRAVPEVGAEETHDVERVGLDARARHLEVDFLAGPERLAVRVRKQFRALEAGANGRVCCAGRVRFGRSVPQVLRGTCTGTVGQWIPAFAGMTGGGFLAGMTGGGFLAGMTGGGFLAGMTGGGFLAGMTGGGFLAGMTGGGFLAEQRRPAQAEDVPLRLGNVVEDDLGQALDTQRIALGEPGEHPLHVRSGHEQEVLAHDRGAPHVFEQ